MFSFGRNHARTYVPAKKVLYGNEMETTSTTWTPLSVAGALLGTDVSLNFPPVIKKPLFAHFVTNLWFRFLFRRGTKMNEDIFKNYFTLASTLKASKQGVEFLRYPCPILREEFFAAYTAPLTLNLWRSHEELSMTSSWTYARTVIPLVCGVLFMWAEKIVGKSSFLLVAVMLSYV